MALPPGLLLPPESTGMRSFAPGLLIAAFLWTAGCGSRDDPPPIDPGTTAPELGTAQPSGVGSVPPAGDASPERSAKAKSQHHQIVLLDDSLSMAATSVHRTPYERAIAFLKQLSPPEPSPDSTGTVSLLRFSKAAAAGAQWDLRNEVAMERPPGALAEAAATAPGSTAAGPREALAACQQQVETAGAGDRFTIYVLSDFRSKDWPESGEARKRLAALAQRDGVQIVLVPCATGDEQNVSVEALQLASQPLPGQSSRLEVILRNHGPQSIARPSVNVSGQQQTGGLLPRETLTFFNVVMPRKEARLPYTFELADSAPVIIEANLTGDLTRSFSLNDALEADNTRYLYFETPEPLNVLVVDELAAEVAPGRFISAALSPLPEVATGYRVEQAGPSSLEKSLAAYATVIIANVPRLTAMAEANLKQYAEGGGAVVYFASKDANARYLTSQLYDEGRGWLPFPLEEVATLAPPASSDPTVRPAENTDQTPQPATADVTFEPGHRAFDVFTHEEFGGAFQQSLRVMRYLKVPSTWQPGEGVQVLARLRDGSPLIVQQQQGQGRAIYVLTAIDPAWTNWMNQPSWVVFHLELQSELHPVITESYSLGQPLEVALDGAAYQPRARWSRVWPTSDEERPQQILNAHSRGIVEGRPLWAVQLNPAEPGVYELILDTLSGEQEGRYYAWNVDPAESDLQSIDVAELAATVEGKIRIEPAMEATDGATAPDEPAP